MSYRDACLGITGLFIFLFLLAAGLAKAVADAEKEAREIAALAG